jgi:hypothetical protein
MDCPAPAFVPDCCCSFVVMGGFVEAIFASAGTRTSNSNAVSSLMNRTEENGRCCASYGMRVIDVSVAAIFA